MGKKNLKKILEKFVGVGHCPLCRRAIRWAHMPALALVVLVAACHSELSEPLQSGKVLALGGLQGRWIGPVVPSAASCGGATTGLMSIGGKGFGFDPFQSTAVIRGDVSDDGHLTGRLVRQGMDRQDVSLNFDGVASGSEAINGTLQSGHCRWTVALRRG